MVHLLLNHFKLPQLIHLLLQLMRCRQPTAVIRLLVQRLELLERSKLVLILHLVNVFIAKHRLQGRMLLTNTAIARCESVFASDVVHILDRYRLCDVH